jgi:hypothetical protein
MCKEDIYICTSFWIICQETPQKKIIPTQGMGQLRLPAVASPNSFYRIIEIYEQQSKTTVKGCEFWMYGIPNIF